MIKLNLTTENDCHQAIKDYLEHNASSNLAEKINNGVKVEKDGKTLINKKTLSGFWSYASKKAQEQKTGYVANETVFGWTIHYFEENDIIGTLYNEDGSEYEPISKPIQRIPAPIVPAKPTPPKPAQASLFDFLANAETPSTDEPTEENIETPAEELNERDEPTELEIDMETGEILTPLPMTETPTLDVNADEDLEALRAQTKHIDKDALCVLLELFDYELDVQ